MIFLFLATHRNTLMLPKVTDGNVLERGVLYTYEVQLRGVFLMVFPWLDLLIHLDGPKPTDSECC